MLQSFPFLPFPLLVQIIESDKAGAGLLGEKGGRSGGGGADCLLLPSGRDVALLHQAQDNNERTNGAVKVESVLFSTRLSLFSAFLRYDTI
jgi:hypothetical protein